MSGSICREQIQVPASCMSSKARAIHPTWTKQSMRGSKIVVELKNDAEISGLLEETDLNMNLTMVDVRQTDSRGSVRVMDVAMIQGKMIRYIHIPDEIDATSNLEKHMIILNAGHYRRNMLQKAS